MPATSKITAKGQITLPKPVREILNVREGDEVLFLYRGGRIIVERLPGAVEAGAAYGILHRPGLEPVDLEAARKRYRAERAKRYAPEPERE